LTFIAAPAAKEFTMKRLITSVVAVVAVSAGFANVADAQNPIKRLVSPRGYMLGRTNDLRRANGVHRPLFRMTKADEVAQHYATLMATVDTKNIIIDYSRLQALGASYEVSFASHDRLDDRHNAAFVLWANSSRDRAKMLDRKFFYMGSGYAISKSGKCYYCMVLVRPVLSSGVEAR
jgi:hypothetical protein